jgi:hypothetical protein
MVVLYVTLSKRVTMRRSTLFSGPLSLLKAGSAGALALATILSCSDSTAPKMTNRDPALDGITVVDFQVADSLKHSVQAPSSSIAISSARIANDMTSVPNAAPQVSAGVLASASAATYTVSSVPFTPEPAPARFLSSCDDCVAYDTPLGFDFTFFGNTYSTVHVGANGFVGFSRSIRDGCCQGGGIPSPGDAPYNNMIAIAWTDLNSGALNSDIRYETQGAAPNRKFVLQFNNVPEYWQGPGRVTAQLVLAEGSNDITIYTFSNTIVTNQFHPVTQGIENADGSEAEFVQGRVRSYFALTNDAVRFSLPRPAVAPVVVPPADISVPTMAPSVGSSARLSSSVSSVGTCDAVVNPGVATVSGDATGVTIAGARSDGLLLDAVYPKGSTTITWTATNTAGLASSASQKVTVEDMEKPVVTAPADVSSGNNPGLASAVVAVGTAAADDNCHGVTVESARSDGAPLDAPYQVGVTSITWTAKDAAGNTAAATQSVTVLDVEAPTITVPASIRVSATSPNGALVNYTTLFDDNVRVTDASCMPASGAMFQMGSTPVTCSASDAAGNRFSKSFTVTVVGPEQQLGDLIAYVLSRDLPNGTTNPLVNQLRAAYRGDNSNQTSCTKMSDFIDMVGKKGDSIPDDRESAYMISEATRIMAAMGCTSAPTATRLQRGR